MHGFETCTTGEATAWPGGARGGPPARRPRRRRPARPLGDRRLRGNRRPVHLHLRLRLHPPPGPRTPPTCPSPTGRCSWSATTTATGAPTSTWCGPATRRPWRSGAAGPSPSPWRRPCPSPPATGWRYALGERDGDGIPDLFALGPGQMPRTAHRHRGVRLLRPGGGDHPGGAGAPPAPSPWRTSTATGAATSTSSTRPAPSPSTWEGSAAPSPTPSSSTGSTRGTTCHWEAGAGCAAGPGRSLRASRGRRHGLGPAALYPDPRPGGWMLSGSLPGGEPWTQARARRGPRPGRPGHPGRRPPRRAARRGGDHGVASTPCRAPAGRVALRAAGGPVRPGGAPGRRCPGPRRAGRRAQGAGLTVRSLDGTRLAAVSRASTPIAAAARDADGDGTSEIVLLGTRPASETLLQVARPRRGGPGRGRCCPVGGRAESLALVSGAQPAVLWRDHGHRAGPRAGVRRRPHPARQPRRAPRRRGAVLAGGGRPDVVVAYRAAAQRHGPGAGPDALTGETSLRALLPTGFDPAAAAAGADGSIVVAGHRLGDGAVLTQPVGRRRHPAPAGAPPSRLAAARSRSARRRRASPVNTPTAAPAAIADQPPAPRARCRPRRAAGAVVVVGVRRGLRCRRPDRQGARSARRSKPRMMKRRIGAFSRLPGRPGRAAATAGGPPTRRSIGPGIGWLPPRRGHAPRPHPAGGRRCPAPPSPWSSASRPPPPRCSTPSPTPPPCGSGCATRAMVIPRKGRAPAPVVDQRLPRHRGLHQGGPRRADLLHLAGQG